ncbi:MAG: hypothetical protein IE922_09180, partial [Sphingomonadales bacterium]|nr:hypothetical protein [Sphingomonadales bacterium]
MRIAFGVILLAGLGLGVLPGAPARAESPMPAPGPGSAATTDPAASPPTEPAAEPATEPATEPAWRLIMVEQPGCAYCARWNDQIAPIYPKTPEGKLARLERVELRETGWRRGLDLGPAPVFTPTFLVMQDAREVGRIEGYPGEDFFWGLLGMALREAGAPLPPTP